MSQEMPPSGSWRSLASTASRSIKGYMAQQREIKQGYPASRTPPRQDADLETKKQTWSQWAGQKLRRSSQSEYDSSGDRLAMFPGWAARRYLEPPKGGDEQDERNDEHARTSSRSASRRVRYMGKLKLNETPFNVDVFVSGYACKLTGIGFNTRGGKTFLRLAKTFASLPKLPVASGLSKSTEELLEGKHLPPLPDEITDETEMQALDDKLRRLELDARSVDSGRGSDTLSVDSSDQSHGSRTPSSMSSAGGNSSTHGYGSTTPQILSGTSSYLQRWHANLEARLHPFWSSAISNRTVRVSLYAADPALYDSDGALTDESASSGSYGSPEKQPILTREVITAADGSFQVKLSVPWEHMCIHPAALHIAFGESGIEQDMFVVAELLAPPPSPGPSTPTAPQFPPSQARSFYAPAPVSTSIHIPLSYSSVRVISDIDDTVKLSGILGGARAVFHNVFVKDLQDSVIRGMGDWYMGMWKRGVRFHYVSNGPFELLPVVNEFLQISQLPPGSIRLRSYGGRSLFNGLLSAPAMRKRVGVLDVLNQFPESRFFLVGDSGEQDLELYAEIARERPEQILAVFIRDASARDDKTTRPLEDPTGAQVTTQAPVVPSAGQTNSRTLGRRAGFKQQRPSRSSSDTVPPAVPPRSYSGTDAVAVSSSRASASSAPPSYGDYFSSGSSMHSPVIEEPRGSPGMMTTERDQGREPSWPPPGFSRPLQTGLQEGEDSSRTPSPTQSPLSDVEKKRVELQMRLWKARLDVPPHIPIRIFREPEECVEVDGILERLQVRGR